MRLHYVKSFGYRIRDFNGFTLSSKLASIISQYKTSDPWNLSIHLPPNLNDKAISCRLIHRDEGFKFDVWLSMADDMDQWGGRHTEDVKLFEKRLETNIDVARDWVYRELYFASLRNTYPRLLLDEVDLRSRVISRVCFQNGERWDVDISHIGYFSDAPGDWTLWEVFAVADISETESGSKRVKKGPSLGRMALKNSHESGAMARSGLIVEGIAPEEAIPLLDILKTKTGFCVVAEVTRQPLYLLWRYQRG